MKLYQTIKKIAFLSSITLCFFCANSAFSEWKEFFLNNSQFSIKFPSQPKYSSDTADFDGGKTVIHSWTLDLTGEEESEYNDEENVFYKAAVTQYPSDYMHSDSSFESIDAFFNSSQSEFQEDKDFTLVSATVSDTLGYPSKTFRWKHSNTRFIDYRVILINSTLYEISLVTLEEMPFNETKRKFFESIAFKDLKAGKFTIAKKEYIPSYDIAFKSKPNLIEKHVSAEFGLVTTNLQILDMHESDKILFMSSETDLSPEMVNIAAQDINKYYQELINSSLQTTSSTLNTINNIKYENFAGKEITASMFGGAGLLTGRFFLIDGKYYQLLVITEANIDATSEILKFFNSFKLKKNK